MNYRLLVVGKVRGRWLQEGIEEYKTRLSRYGKVRIDEIPDQPCPKNKSAWERALKKEGEQILSRIDARAHVLALDIRGRSMDSEALAAYLAALALRGVGEVTLCIGGSMGLHAEILGAAAERISFSALTFPHGLIRLFVLEQLYRASKINAAETYHK